MSFEEVFDLFAKGVKMIVRDVERPLCAKAIDETDANFNLLSGSLKLNVGNQGMKQEEFRYYFLLITLQAPDQL